MLNPVAITLPFWSVMIIALLVLLELPDVIIKGTPATIYVVEATGIEVPPFNPIVVVPNGVAIKQQD